MRDLVILLIDETGLAVAIPILPIGSWLGQTPSRLEVSSDTCPGGHGPNPGLNIIFIAMPRGEYHNKDNREYTARSTPG